MSKIYDIISQNIDTYTKSHRTVAGYILDNYDEAGLMTLKDLADAAGVSTTTVVRFSRDLGFDGYSDMQSALRADLKVKAGLPERLDVQSDISEDELLRKCIQADISNIEQTFSINSTQTLHEALAALSLPSTLYIMGMRRSYTLANYAFSGFGQIRKDVHLINGSGMNYPEELLPAKQGDVCLIFMFPRYSHTTLKLMQYLKNTGVRILLVTSANHDAINRYADIILGCRTTSISAKSSYAGPIALINYLIAAYMQQNKASSKDMLAKTEQLLTDSMMLGF